MRLYFYCVFSHIKPGRKEDEKSSRRRNAKHCKQSTDSNGNCSESVNIENDVHQSLNMENDVEVRTEASESTNSLSVNTEPKIFITDIENMSNKANLSDAQKYHLLKNHFKLPPVYKFP